MFPQETLIITNDVRYMKQAARKDLKTSSRKRSYIRLSDTLENAQSYVKFLTTNDSRKVVMLTSTVD